MRNEVEDYLRGEPGASVSIRHLVDALSQSNRIKNAYAKQKESLFGPISRRLKHLMAIARGQNNPALEARYQITTVLRLISRRPSATAKLVNSWDDLKKELSLDMDFAEPSEEVSSQFAALRVTPKFELVQLTSPPPPISPADKKLMGVAQSVAPKKIEYEELGEKGPWAEHLEQKQAERAVEKAEEDARYDELEQQLEEKQKEEEAKKLASSLLRDYTNEEEDMIQSATCGPGWEQEVLQSEGPDTVLRGSMRTLRPGQWLNDEIIHFFLVMLAKRDEELCLADPDRKRSHFFKSFFITKLRNEGHTDPNKDGAYEYRNVKRWSKKVPGKDIFNLDKIIFPINQGRMHWVCAVAFMQEKRIQFYDSMGSSGKEYLDDLFQYIKDEHQDKKKAPLPDEDQWELVTCTSDTPQQGNGFDCGVFTCMFADFLSKNCPLLFSQKHVDQCRKRVALSILLGKAIL
ncbi:Sentrin-specific protease 2 [Seminavis robusta]|uniref:Sentrin-specific protease 2 n=1 Tax=Seminavis robusta TaxID=568900 RepID=A0A9N8HLP8_9STRA|nr:Sentrin-specific protease 2 [Seminavis robusta]|eukprot:Sro841_g209540.1 Sentrin-specific protease 2 (461) ;mRNA; f:22271-23743